MPAYWIKCVVFVALGIMATLPLKAAELAITSPDGAIVLTVKDDGGHATYEISHDGNEAIRPSRLGILFRDHHGFEGDLAISDHATASHDATWEQPWGERRLVRDHHNELAVTFAAQKGPAREITVRFRVFDTGVGLRYELEEQEAFQGHIAITDELTQFAIANDADAWWTPSRQFNRYEYIYRKGQAGTVDDAHTPVTFRRQNGVHISIHEAALVDYSAMSLLALRPGDFEAQLRAGSDGIKVHTSAPFKSPWRTIQIAPDAVGLINSDIILNLNEPNKLGDVSWVEPGKYVGVWWEMHIRDRTWGNDGIHGANNADVIRHIDFAAKHGFNGVLVEGWNTGWDGDWFNNGELFSFTETYPDFDLPMLSQYAADKGVRLIGHHETSGNVANYEAQMEEAFDLYQSHGIREVKTGYVADAGDIVRYDENGIKQYEWHDSQFMVGHHLRVLEEAAKRRISINAHEPVKDTGLRRTYPNWMTREGARGMEFNAWGTPPNPTDHISILAYTRMLSGPMDFTPGIFDLRPNEKPPLREDMQRGDPSNRPQTTLAKQLALYVVLYSPLQMAADLPENYEARMDAFQFIKDVEADWEESVAIAGEVGEYVAIARKGRAGGEWFLGAVTDEESRALDLPLTFLEDGKTYTAQVYRDGDDAHWDTNPYDYVIEEIEVMSGGTLPVKLASSGGVAVRFIEK
ncbi:glycoside hydrolase family 97 protein [Erythrobacter sp. SCSIO 43205]|uniref:glycoside hydrolase family 97 protein n=1 Tax=Erythrobacter sp. SCSIO 43205 TaxID=2779361 RepID=UPI001CA9E910|nr:glycoside hydrolase family 97 protein [Erythrobacter sp. SCSIO 43205]UAB78831.1 glycoside hydrolase family 97 protein [Erythrobacter sp. SCSIO 43205]